MIGASRSLNFANETPPLIDVTKNNSRVEYTISNLPCVNCCKKYHNIPGLASLCITGAAMKDGATVSIKIIFLNVSF